MRDTRIDGIRTARSVAPSQPMDGNIHQYTRGGLSGRSWPSNLGTRRSPVRSISTAARPNRGSSLSHNMVDDASWIPLTNNTINNREMGKPCDFKSYPSQRRPSSLESFSNLIPVDLRRICGERGGPLQSLPDRVCATSWVGVGREPRRHR